MINRPAIILTSLLLTACTTPSALRQELMHHHWVLESVDQRPVQSERGRAPDLEIGEHFTVNGIAGCNRYFGKGNLKQGRFWVTSLGSTEMACGATLDVVEQAVLTTLRQGAALTTDAQGLTLQGEQHTLRYRLEEWK